MKPFRLNKVLEVRRHVRTQRRNDLAAILAEEQLLIDQRDELSQQRAKQVQEIGQLGQQSTVDVEATARRRYFTGVIDVRLMVLGQQIQQMAEFVEKYREALIEADRDVKSLERLEEEHFSAERYSEERRTEHELSEQWQAANWNH
jgi:flagellar protein FliJ